MRLPTGLAFITIYVCTVIATQMKCDPGSFRSTEKGEDCTPCPPGTYMSEHNRELSCHECSTCSLWPRTVTECSATQDRVCGCYDGYDKTLDGCVKKTAESYPLWNCTASVDRIQEIIMRLHVSLNGTHEDTISQISSELRNLNRTLTRVLDHLDTHAIQQVSSESTKWQNMTQQLANTTEFLQLLGKIFTQNSTLVFPMNQTHNTIIEDGHTQRCLLITVTVLLCFDIILVQSWEFGKERLYRFFSNLFGRIRKHLKRGHSGYSPLNSKGYMPLDIKVLKDVTQIKHAVCGDYEDDDTSDKSLQQMVKKLTILTNGTELEEPARALNEAIFGEDNPPETSDSIRRMIAEIVAVEIEQNNLPNKEQIICTAKNIQNKIFGDNNSEERNIGEASMRSAIKKVFQEARAAFHYMFSQKAAKIQRKFSRSTEVQGSQADSKFLKITRTLTKLSSCREVKIVEATKRLLRNLGETIPACEYFNKKDCDLLNALAKHAQESVRQEAHKIKAALTAEIIEDSAIDGLHSKYKTFSVKKLVRELVSCSNGLPFRSSITELEYHLFGQRSLRHMVSSLVFDEQQQETALCLSHVESEMNRWKTAIDGSKTAEQEILHSMSLVKEALYGKEQSSEGVIKCLAEQKKRLSDYNTNLGEVTTRQDKIVTALSKFEVTISEFERWKSQVSQDLNGITKRLPENFTSLLEMKAELLKLEQIRQALNENEAIMKKVDVTLKRFAMDSTVSSAAEAHDYDSGEPSFEPSVQQPMIQERNQ